jgi:iron-sulfur cluster insertion protein
MDQVSLTPAAARRVLAIAERQGAAPRLRLAVEGGGCSGFTYRFALADTLDADDSLTGTDGAELVVDAVSLDLLRGSEVDYVESLGGASFQVRNPNAASGCGCGSSFAI